MDSVKLKKKAKFAPIAIGAILLGSSMYMSIEESHRGKETLLWGNLGILGGILIILGFCFLAYTQKKEPPLTES